MSKPVKIVQLVHIQGPFKGEIQEFAEDQISIGRNPQCTLTFPPDLAIVSRNHAEIVREGERFKVIDHSANGTYVNGKRVTEAFLKDGDVLTIAHGGPKISFLTKETDQAPGPAEPRQESRPEAGCPSTPQQASHVSPPRQARTPKPRSAQPPGPRGQEAMVPLVIQFGPTLRSYKRVPVVIGAHPNCDFPMEHPGILDRHAEIFYTQDQYWIKDLTSLQLVCVNGAPVDLGMPLNTHDEISLTPEGPFFTFLGGGRLAQVEKDISPGKDQPPSDGPSAHEPTPQPSQKVEKKGKSFFRKVLKR